MPYSVSFRKGGGCLLCNNVSITTPYLSYEDIFNLSFYVSTNFHLIVSDDNVTFIRVLHIRVHNNAHVVNISTMRNPLI